MYSPGLKNSARHNHRRVRANEATYMTQLEALIDERNTIAGHMIQMIEGAEFAGLPFYDIAARFVLRQAKSPRVGP
jgi:hypothetical protein